MADHELNILVKAKGALQAARDIGRVDSAVGGLSRTASRGVRTAARNTALIGVGAAVGVGAAAKRGIESLAELEDATTSVAGAIKQTGLTGQTTAAQVATWANEIEGAVGAAFDDKDITAATATLIRFGKVTPANIRPAMEIMTDLAVKTGSVDSAATLLAKALADPTKAAGKLARQGIILTKEQQATIKAMVEANDVAGAQALILGEVEKTTKGAAAASQGPYRRSLSVLADVTEDAQRALGEGFLPVIQKVSDILQGELAKPGTMTNIREFGKGLASGLDHLIDIARNLPWGVIGDSLKLAGAGAKAVLGAFAAMPPWVQTAVLTGWGLNKLSGGALGSIVSALGSGLIKGVLGMNAGVVNINAGSVTGGGLPGGAGGKGGGVSLMALGFAGAVLAAAVPIGEAFAAALPKELKGPGGKGESESQRRIREGQAVMAEKQQATTERIKVLGVTFGRGQRETKSATDRVRAAASETRREVARGANQVAAAIRAKDLSVTVPVYTTVNVTARLSSAQAQTTITQHARVGKANGSLGGGSGRAIW